MSCPEAEGKLYMNSAGIKITLAIQSATCLVAIITNVHFIMKNFKEIYFHHNIKVIILFGIANNVVHCVLLMTLQTIHLTLYCVAQTPCDVFVSTPFCLAFRGPISVFGVNNIPLGVAFLIERLIATLKLKTYEKEYEKSQTGLWLSIGAEKDANEKCCPRKIIFITFIIFFYWTLVAAGMVIHSQRNTPFDGTEFAYCSAANQYTADSITVWSYIQLAAEILSILATLIIWGVNYRAQQVKSYNVGVAYQIHENLAVFKLLFPWMILHLFCFLTFHTANAIIPMVAAWDIMGKRIAYALAYETIPIYALFSPFLLSSIVRQQKVQRGHTLQKLSKTKANAEAYDNYLIRSWY